MSTRLVNDLTAWESGHLDPAEVEQRNPEADVSGLIDLHHLMVDAGSHDVPAPADSWEPLRDALPERGARVSERRRMTSVRLVRRPVLIATATMLLGGSALAMTSEPVRVGVRSALRKVASFVNLDIGESSDRGVDPGGTSGDPGTMGSGPGATRPGTQAGKADHGGTRGKSSDAPGRTKPEGPNTKGPGGRGGPNSEPGNPGSGGAASSGDKPPAAGGKGAGNGPPDAAGKREGPGKSDGAGSPQGSGKADGKDKGKSEGKGKPDGAETPDESGNGTPGGDGNGGNGGNENEGTAGGNGNVAGNGSGGSGNGNGNAGG